MSSYKSVGRLRREAIITKVFYLAIFVLLHCRFISLLLEAIIAGVFFIYGHDPNRFHGQNTLTVIYMIMQYATDGSFIGLALLLFWMLRNAYNHGQVSAANQILELNRGSCSLYLTRT
jgi:hypothetical protein